MLPFEKCPVCGGELVEKEVESKLSTLTGRNDKLWLR